tara:strand:+ start:98781 stop:100124 length:1344 start_codon:yes stop_codon:yes gene_type:complete
LKPELFGTLDLLIGFGWIILVFGVAFWIYLVNSTKKHFRWYLPNLGFRILFGLLFGAAYAIVLTEGGDTIAYHDGAFKLSQLFWDSPSEYFMEMFSTPGSDTIREHFNEETGYPPSWIYREPESFFVCKIISIFSLLSFNSYVAMTIMASTFSAFASWRLFKTLKRFDACPKWIIIVATMFVPTVAFWCSGISKDTFVLGAFYLIFSYLYPLFIYKERLKLSSLLGILFFGFILYHLRSFMLLAIALPFIIALLFRWAKLVSENVVLLYVYRVLIAFVMIISVIGYVQFTGGSIVEENELLQEVVVIQKDFAQNKTYTGYRYDLGIDDYSAWGMIKATPLAIITAFYRPFLWEANSAFLLISGLESMLLLFLTFRFFFLSGNLIKHLKFIGSKELLIFSILFALILGFFVGFTSGLFNVLVRFKAPIMVFIIIFFASRNKEEKKLNI